MRLLQRCGAEAGKNGNKYPHRSLLLPKTSTHGQAKKSVGRSLAVQSTGVRLSGHKTWLKRTDDVSGQRLAKKSLQKR